MSTYHAVTIQWSRVDDKECYSWIFDNGVVIDSQSITLPTHGIGVDPESALVAAVTSGHMIAFLETCALEGIQIISYQDRAVGFVVTNRKGKSFMDRIVLSPKVELASKEYDPSLLTALHDKAQSNSFITKSIVSSIEIKTPLHMKSKRPKRKNALARFIGSYS